MWSRSSLMRERARQEPLALGAAQIRPVQSVSCHGTRTDRWRMAEPIAVHLPVAGTRPQGLAGASSCCQGAATSDDPEVMASELVAKNLIRWNQPGGETLGVVVRVEAGGRRVVVRLDNGGEQMFV